MPGVVGPPERLAGPAQVLTDANLPAAPEGQGEIAADDSRAGERGVVEQSFAKQLTHLVAALPGIEGQAEVEQVDPLAAQVEVGAQATPPVAELKILQVV